MNIYDRGYIYENTYNEYLMKVEHEVKVSSLLTLPYDVLHRYFKGDTIVPAFRVYVLTSDEIIDYEISRDVVSLNPSITYQSGQRRTMTMVLANQHGKWKYGARDNLWDGMKFGLDTGVVIGDTLYWMPQGIYLMQGINPSRDGSNETISVQLCDKWGLWDGTVYGTTQFKTIVPTEVPMRQAFNTIIHEDNGLGEMWDTKPIRFNTEYWDTRTFYTIKQDAGQTMGQVLLDMAKTISSDNYYDTQGRLCVESNVWDFINNNFPVVWRFNDGDADCDAPQITYNRNKYYNQIKTKGAVVNGYQFTGTAQNRNRKSLYNIYDTPLTPKTNSNPKLYADWLCAEQSRYEMVQQSRGLKSVTLKCTFLPFLDVNQAVILNFPNEGIENEIYIIDSISYSIGSDCRMSLSLTSSAEVVF